jgi:hypothetical protein
MRGAEHSRHQPIGHGNRLFDHQPRCPKYPGEVPVSRGQAGQAKDGLVLCHQVRTVDVDRVTTYELGGRVQCVTDPDIRQRVRTALLHQLGLDIPATADGAA